MIYYAIFINVFLIVSLLLVLISNCYQPNIVLILVQEFGTNRVRFNGIETHVM